MPSDLMEAFYEGMTGAGYTGPDSTHAELANALVHAAGTAKAAAAILGIGATTLYRWRFGTQKPKTPKDKLVKAVRKASMPTGMYDDIKHKRKTCKIKGEITVSGDTRDREVNVGKYIPSRKMMNVVKAWMAGDDARAERLLWKHIDAHYVDGIEIDNVQHVKFTSDEI